MTNPATRSLRNVLAACVLGIAGISKLMPPIPSGWHGRPPFARQGTVSSVNRETGDVTHISYHFRFDFKRRWHVAESVRVKAILGPLPAGARVQPDSAATGLIDEFKRICASEGCHELMSMFDAPASRWKLLSNTLSAEA